MLFTICLQHNDMCGYTLACMYVCIYVWKPMNDKTDIFLSDSNAYAHYVFNTFDADQSGSISFEVIKLL